MKYLANAILFVLLILNSVSIYSQGCSDAGVCTIYSLKEQPGNLFDELQKKNHFYSGITYGIGEHSISYVNPYVEYTGFISKKISISGKLTYTFIYGELDNVSNLGDLNITGSYVLVNRENHRLGMFLGAKIPMNNSNIKKNDEPLPMHYQTSLGTYDLIIGANYMFANLGVGIALQQPVYNKNENEFLKPTDTSQKEYKYYSTNSFERKGDIITRISYNFNINEEKWSIRPGVLGIYHLADDTYVDAANMETEISGSKGITVNANLFVNYTISDSKRIEFSFGSPLVTRDSRPDGLTRKLVVGLEYKYSF